MRLVGKRINHTSPSTKGIFVFILLIAASLALPVRERFIDIDGVLSATAIFYSILLGFYIAAAMANLSRLKTLVATETGALIAVYNLVKLALPGKIDQVRDSIDRYIIKRFEYEVDTYTEPTTKEFFGIFDILKDAETNTQGQGAALNYIAEAEYYVAQARREMTIVGAKVVSTISWLILITLSLIIVGCLLLMRDGTLESALICAFLSAAAILSLFILADVDGNRFGEEHFAIDTYQDVFSAIGVLPYYSAHYLEAGRYFPSAKKYRVGKPGKVEIVDN